jgi:hypothetical protein
MTEGEVHVAVSIPRPPVPADAESRVEALQRVTDRRIDALEATPSTLSGAFSGAKTTAKARTALDPGAQKIETWEAFVAAMQIGSALFASATATEGTVECRIARKSLTIPATGPQSYTDAGNWLDAFWLAVICREQGRMTALCNVPVSLLRASGAVYDEYIYAWIETLQTYWLKGPNVSDKLVAAMDGTDPGVLPEDSQEVVLEIMYPPINLFFRFLTQDHDRFNAELAKALEWHKGYWTKDEERSGSTAGLVALGPLALACLAHDAGFPIEVTSEYLPEGLLDRGWLGEFDT